MKYLIILTISMIGLMTYSQCAYSVIDYDRSSGKGYMKSDPITLDYYETPFNGRIIVAHLIRFGSQYFIEIEITSDSSAQDLEPICFEKGARLSFSLKNRKVVSLSQIEDKICGVKTTDSRSGYTTVSNYARFILTQSVFDELKKSEIVLMKLADTNYDRSFVLKEEIKELFENETKITNPGKFFIENIDCLIKPKFD